MTTIAIKPETKKVLDSIGSKGESYDDIINELLEVYVQFLKRQEDILENDKFVELKL